MNITERGSGVLLPVFSLSGKYGIGSFSKEARKFVDFLSDSKQKYWQILPLGPTSYGDSPYQAFSTFALNPYFIDIDTLVEEELLTPSEAKKARPSKDKSPADIDYSWLYETRFFVLKKAFERFEGKNNSDYANFCNQNGDWLGDYSLFMAAKNKFNGVSFYQWPKEISRHNCDAVEALEKELESEVEFYKFLQFKAFQQWKSLKQYANSKNIKIIGDIPIYVAADSSDVWTKPELFQMDELGSPKSVAGCPPDGFSADGQLWGNPLYNWEYHDATGYEWWCRRIEKCRELYDVIRIDHFRGFDEYYSVPAKDDTARNGCWCKGPGLKLFKAIEEKHGELDIIAEDLGYITDSVKQLVKDTGFPNMKVLEFAFDSRDSSGPSLYLPHNYEKNCVVYTGTHDNETIFGWLNSIQPDERKLVEKYVDKKGAKPKELADALVRLAQSSTAILCIIPIQDYLCLDNDARINHPSTLGTNWRWRLEGRELTKTLSKKISALTMLYGRG